MIIKRHGQSILRLRLLEPGAIAGDCLQLHFEDSPGEPRQQRGVRTLRAEPGKDTIVDGGPSLVHEVIQQGLVDDYRMGIWPVILGRRRPPLGLGAQSADLRLVDVKTLTYGRLFLFYEAVR
jgi:riboflavin biosynthesis pyrimidine reductase